MVLIAIVKHWSPNPGEYEVLQPPINTNAINNHENQKQLHSPETLLIDENELREKLEKV